MGQWFNLTDRSGGVRGRKRANVTNGKSVEGEETSDAERQRGKRRVRMKERQ